jgi:hypothetical protein
LKVLMLFEYNKYFIWFVYCVLINIQLLKELYPTARLLLPAVCIYLLRSILQADNCIVYLVFTVSVSFIESIIESIDKGKRAIGIIII